MSAPSLQSSFDMATICREQTLADLLAELREYPALHGEDRRIARGYVLRLVRRLRFQDARRMELHAAWMRTTRDPVKEAA